MKEGIFSKWRESGLSNKYTMFWISERGDNKFQVFGRGIQKGGDMWDQELYDNTHLISYNKYLVYYLLKKN